MTRSAALPCVCLAGPTGAGKTAAALAIADHLRRHDAVEVEVVSVDSALVYRGMDIGTAKPTASERAAVPHHLIDLIEPNQAYSAARFVDDAARLIAEVRQRGAVPLLVGGTMLYFKALFEGLDAMPPSDPAVRAAVDADAARLGWPALHEELQRVDPVTAARLPPGDTQRIQRALEVHRLSGRPLSSFHTRADQPRRPAPVLLSLEPEDRAWLHARLAERFDAMLRQGLVDEVRRLRARGDLHADLPSMRCVGYRQAWQVLDRAAARGDERGGGAVDAPLQAALRDTGLAATRQLAKRQLTWLRGLTMRQVIACNADDALQQVVQAARPHLLNLMSCHA